MQSGPTARILMCPPEHFAVSYAINPWMDPAAWSRDEHEFAALARREWNELHRSLRNLGAAIELLPAAPGMPDLVFTANSAVVLDGTVLLSRFRHPERRREEPNVEKAFLGLKAHGLVDAIKRLPEGLVLEGAGDCVWDQTRDWFWMGYGPRSHAGSQKVIEEIFGVEAVPLELTDDRFYHVDTALSALPRGEVMYIPQAFSPAARRAIRARVPLAQRIEISGEDANLLAANAVCIGDTVVMSGCSPKLRGKLAARGYRVEPTPLRAFLRSGGAAFCLTLRLDWQSTAKRATADATAA